MVNSFLLLLETILFSVNLDEPESELEKHSLAYLIFKWYQAHYLYNVLINPNYQKEELFGGRYWIVHHIKESIPRLEQYIKKIGKLIYKKAKPIFLDWATEHDVEHFEDMMKKRLDDIENKWTSFGEYINEELRDWDIQLDFAEFLENALIYKDGFYPFNTIPKVRETILEKIKEFFKNCNVKEILKDSMIELKNKLRKTDNEWLIKEISYQIDSVKKMMNKPKNQWTEDDLHNIAIISLRSNHDIFFQLIQDNLDNPNCQENIVWLYIIYYLIGYFEHKGYNELPQWIDKVEKIHELFKYDQPPSNLKELVLLIEKIINFTHNNGHLLIDHVEMYNEDLSIEEYREIGHITGENIYDLYDLLDYFAKNEYKDPELVKTLERYKYYHVHKKRK